MNNNILIYLEKVSIPFYFGQKYMNLSLKYLSNVIEFKEVLKSVLILIYIMFFIILGPGSYDIPSNTVIVKVQNTCLKKPQKTAFGSSVPRTLISDQKEVSSGPAPCDYQMVC